MAYQSESYTSRVDWGAIWAGLFTFLAIWAVFGLLGVAIFTSNLTQPVATLGVGMGIWTVILTVVAMYVAGMETGRLAGSSNRHDGVLHGMAMFGLALAAVVLLADVGSMAAKIGETAAAISPLPTIGVGWAGFFTLFLGWLAALAGSTQGVRPRVQSERPAQQVRTAA